MAGWGDLGSHTGFRNAHSGGFPCGFSVVGRLGPLHEAGQAVGLRGRRAYRAVGLGLKSHDTHNAPPFSRLKVGTSSIGKNMVFLNLEWRLKGLGELMRALNVCLDVKRL